MDSIKKNWLIIVAAISLLLIINAGFYIYYQNSKICTITSTSNIESPEKNQTVQTPLDYEDFKLQWGLAWIGLELDNVTPAMAAIARLDRVEGAYITDVTNNSPAQKAGIEPGTIILSFNGRKIRTPEQFQNDLAGSEIGTQFYICLSNANERTTVNLIPEERPSYLPVLIKTYPYIGVIVNDIAEGSADAEKIEEAEKAGGVLVEEVIPGSPAEIAGLLKDDIIMSFNSRKTRTLREFLSDLSGCQPGETVRMCIMREDVRKTLFITLEHNII